MFAVAVLLSVALLMVEPLLCRLTHKEKASALSDEPEDCLLTGVGPVWNDETATAAILFFQPFFIVSALVAVTATHPVRGSMVEYMRSSSASAITASAAPTTALSTFSPTVGAYNGFLYESRLAATCSQIDETFLLLRARHAVQQSESFCRAVDDVTAGGVGSMSDEVSLSKVVMLLLLLVSALVVVVVAEVNSSTPPIVADDDDDDDDDADADDDADVIDVVDAMCTAEAAVLGGTNGGDGGNKQLTLLL